MIQRLQSVFLALIIILVATLCGISVLHLVYIEPEKKSTEYVLNLFYFNKLENGVLLESHLQILLIILASVVIGISLFVMVNFKNRLKQMTFTILNGIAILALEIAFAFKAYFFIPAFNSSNMLLPSIIGITAFLFLIYLNIRVYYLIKKDEELVRSADRIR